METEQGCTVSTDYDAARERLFARVEEVAAGEPSLAELYALEKDAEYFNQLYDARDVFLDRWRSRNREAAWLEELKRRSCLYSCVEADFLEHQEKRESLRVATPWRISREATRMASSKPRYRPRAADARRLPT